MKRTIVWPPKVRGGRLAMTEDPETDPLDPDAALRQIIRLNLLDGSSSNPWNAGVGTTDPTFSRNDAATQARLRARVRDVFQRLERTKRAKLVAVRFPRDPQDPARLVLEVEYVNLETSGRLNMEIAPNG